MAHTKSGGSTKLGRESRSKRLGVKVQDGEPVVSGEIIVRQRGSKYIPATGVRQGADDTLYASKNGVVRFAQKSKIRFDGKKRRTTVVAVR
ncbi:MAG: 50S ribosomal protein L27 [Patescibacteria group bacterium]|mgnify:CR=1 FL=1